MRSRWERFFNDIGKIGLADAVLRKPGSLAAEEFRHG